MAEELSKSAKKRAAKKTRDEAHAEEAPAPAPAPAPPAPKAKAKAAASAPAGGYPEAKAKAKATPAPQPEPKAKAKAKAKAEPEPAPKAKAKAKGKAEPAPAPPAPAPPAPEPKAKSQPKQQAKAKAKPVPVEVPKPEKEEEFVPMDPWEIDDGSGPAWEASSGKTKKQANRDEKKKQDALIAKSTMKAVNDKYIPGMTGAPQAYIPGMGPAPGSKAAVNQSVAATGAAVAAAAAKAREEQEKAKSGTCTASIVVPEAKIGVVIGPKGAMIKLIQEKTGVRIDTQDQNFTITGPAEGVASAESAIQDLITKGYTPLAYENFSENFVMVPGTSFPDLIGKGGVIVQAIKKELGVEVSFPPTKKGMDTKKYKVTIAGPVKNVEKCKEVINDIVNFGHHEITHPGDGHEEIEVPEWCYAAVIGKKGCELRHIKNSYGVSVMIPRETSINQNVVLVGPVDQLPKAKNYVEKAVYRFENQIKGRDRGEGAAEDPWGAEEPMEEWEKQYMYKR